jgi:hypothetical protein
MDDFSNIDDYMGSEMNESGCIGSPVVRKLGCGRTKKLDYSHTEKKDGVE